VLLITAVIHADSNQHNNNAAIRAKRYRLTLNKSTEVSQIGYLFFGGPQVLTAVHLWWSRSRWSSGYRVCHWTQGSQVKNRLRMAKFHGWQKIRSTTSFGGEVKPPAEYDRDTLPTKWKDISRQFLPASQLNISAGICHTAFVHESWTIRTQTGKNSMSEMTAVHWTLCMKPSPWH
jgi:hypothetical protein